MAWRIEVRYAILLRSPDGARIEMVYRNAVTHGLYLEFHEILPWLVAALHALRFECED